MSASTLPSSSRLLFDELLLRPNLRLRVGDQVIDVGALRMLTHPAHPRLTSKAMAVLIELVRNAGNTVTRDHLLDRVWADRVTTPDVLTQAIKELRRAFLDDAKPSLYIETIPRVGYRLLAPVSVIGDEVSIIAEGTPLTQAENDPERDAPLADESPAPPLAPQLSRSWRLDLRPLNLLLFGLLFVLLVGLWMYRPMLRAAGDAGWSVSDVRVVTSDPGVERRPAVSPDGTRVAYSQLETQSGIERVYIRVIGQSQSVLLTGKSSTSEEVPTWSPDGTQIAFERLDGEHCTMHIASIVGGAEHDVGECHDFIVNYFDWMPDGKALLTSDNADGVSGRLNLVRWDLETGKKEPFVYSRTTESQDLEAHYSHDGKMIAFRRGLAPYSDLYVMSAIGGEVRQLTNLSTQIRGLAWTIDNNGLIFSASHEGSPKLYTVALSDGRITALDVGPAVYPASARSADVVVYEIPRSINRLAQIDLRSEKTNPVFLAKSTGNDGSPTPSPQGDRIAFISNRTGSQQIWLYEFANASASALTDVHDAVLTNPAWSDDGKHILVTIRDAQGERLLEIDLATRQQRAISRADEKVLSGDYGPDPDSYLLTVAKASAHNEYVLLEHAGSNAETRRTLAHGIEHAQLDKALRRVYFTKNAEAGLFSRDLAADNEKTVTTSVGSNVLDGWRLVDGHIWYISKLAWIPTDLMDLDLTSGKSQVIGHLQAELRDAAFSVAASRDRIFIAPLGLEDTDVGSFRLSRPAR